MVNEEPVKIVIVDNHLKSSDSLNDYFSEMVEVEIIRCEIDSSQLKKTIITNNPDLFLVDIEKLNGIEERVFEELLELKDLKFKVILYSTNNSIHLLQSRTIKSIPDLLTSNDLRITIQDYVNDKKYQRNTVKSDSPVTNKFIAFQTFIGLRFINKQSVVFFEYTQDEKSQKRLWEAHLDNSEVIKLKLNTSSKDIIKHFENHDFIQISQSNIVNMHFFSSIELKSRKCILLSPYENKEMIISRAYLNEIKSRFEID